jgi:hypothetical protein
MAAVVVAVAAAVDFRLTSDLLNRLPISGGRFSFSMRPIHAPSIKKSEEFSASFFDFS